MYLSLLLAVKCRNAVGNILEFYLTDSNIPLTATTISLTIIEVYLTATTIYLTDAEVYLTVTTIYLTDAEVYLTDAEGYLTIAVVSLTVAEGYLTDSTIYSAGEEAYLNILSGFIGFTRYNFTYGFFPSFQLGLKSVLTNHRTGFTIEFTARVRCPKSTSLTSSLA